MNFPGASASKYFFFLHLFSSEWTAITNFFFTKWTLYLLFLITWSQTCIWFLITRSIKHLYTKAALISLLAVKDLGFSSIHSKAVVENSLWVLICHGKACWSTHFLHADQMESRCLPHWSLGCFCLQILEPDRALAGGVPSASLLHSAFVWFCCAQEWTTWRSIKKGWF